MDVNEMFGQDEDGKPETPHPLAPSPTRGEGELNADVTAGAEFEVYEAQLWATVRATQPVTEFEYCPKCHSGNTTCMFEQDVMSEHEDGGLYQSGAWGAFKCLDCDERWWESE